MHACHFQHSPPAGPTPSALNRHPCTLNPRPSTLDPKPSTLDPQPSTLNPSTLNPNAAQGGLGQTLVQGGLGKNISIHSSTRFAIHTLHALHTLHTLHTLHALHTLPNPHPLSLYPETRNPKLYPNATQGGSYAAVERAAAAIRMSAEGSAPPVMGLHT
jgi:hypothetical protein